ncbi:50S ribosomal protein L21 [Durusdinium trenchii]|uniref:Large ribosomal subunit protein bL21m n=1 Tax=Durusdinium trenchii TaxID=1381693 RepID=A0ABP0ME71_9DINO
MYAIIEESGGQRKVTEGEEILIDLYKGGEAGKGDPVTFDKVLVIGDAGGSAKVGTPHVGGASVTAEVIEPAVKGDKIDIHKYRPKKASRSKTGHRQRYTLVKVTGLKG